MTRPVYEGMLPIRREEALREIASGASERVGDALVRLALHDPDRAFVEDIVAAQLASPDSAIRRIAATCAGHLARIHRALDTARLVPLIHELAGSPDTVGNMEDALSDIEMFVPHSFKDARLRR